MSIKERATKFLRSVAMGDIKTAFEDYVAADCIHHNQYFKGDRASLLEAMQADHEKQPNLSIEIRYTYVDGDTVITHSHVTKAQMEIAVVHIMRFSGESIVEIWDLGQVIEQDSPNENGLF